MRYLVFDGDTWEVYKFDDKYVYIFAIGGHYEQF
jgi:hypothetical protein